MPARSSASNALRAENSNTSRHLAEFWMIEPEIAFADLSDNAALAEALLNRRRAVGRGGRGSERRTLVSLLYQKGRDSRIFHAQDRAIDDFTLKGKSSNGSIDKF